MRWVLWRQYRLQLAIASALLVGLAVPVLTTGRSLADQLVLCRAGTTCGGVFDGYQAMVTLVDLTVVLPLLLGAFVAAAAFGRDFESGTAVLVWTQSVTRMRWVLTKLAATFGLCLVCAVAVAAGVTWWSNTHNALVESRLAGLQFDIQGISPIGYTLFAVALGLSSGALWRRVIPAMATTVAGFIGVRLLIELALRPVLMAPVVRSFPFTKTDGMLGPGANQISSELVLHGRVVSGPVGAPATCAGRDIDSCMQRLGYSIRITYQSASRFWQVQWLEFGIFAVLTVVLTVVAVTAVLRRDA